MSKPTDIGTNVVNVVAILSLTILGGAWAYLGTENFVYVGIMIVVGVAGLGGYSLKKGQVPFPGNGGGNG